MCDKARGYLPEHHACDYTERGPDCRKTLKGITLLLDYWRSIHHRNLLGPPESLIKNH
jgi:hypothetical protein